MLDAHPIPDLSGHGLKKSLSTDNRLVAVSERHEL